MPSTSKTPIAAEPAVEAEDRYGVPDEDTPEWTGEQFERAQVGKYYFESMRGSNVVRIADDLIEHFPNEEAVNDALRGLVALRRVLVPRRADADDGEAVAR